MTEKRLFGVVKGHREHIADHTGRLYSDSEVADLLNTVHEENEQLKKELRIYRKVASCSNCNYHNYDWFDDGDEFEVCDKGNDVTEGICEDWREL